MAWAVELSAEEPSVTQLLEEVALEAQTWDLSFLPRTELGYAVDGWVSSGVPFG
jgi:hypothetical protein